MKRYKRYNSITWTANSIRRIRTVLINSYTFGAWQAICGQCSTTRPVLVWWLDVYIVSFHVFQWSFYFLCCSSFLILLHTFTLKLIWIIKTVVVTITTPSFINATLSVSTLKLPFKTINFKFKRFFMILLYVIQ